MIKKSKTRLTPPLKWHGGKSYLADWIIDLIPKHLHYVEPYAGGLAILLNKNPFDERHQWGNKAHECGISEVVVLCSDALKVIREQDGERTLFYLDPPYVHETRATINAYAYEMDTVSHRALLDTIQQCKGRVMLSGYPNDLYDKALHNWNRHDREIDNKVSNAASKRTRH